MDKPQQLMTTTTGLATLQRPRFIPGMLLEDEDMNAGVSYARDLTRLLFRSLFGCGVICGLQVSAQLICKGSKLKITIPKGLALDCSGNPLEIPETQAIEFNPDCKDFPPAIWVSLCYFEKPCRPKDVSCAGSDDGQSQPTRTREGFSIRLYDGPPACACRCNTAESAPPAADRDCGCGDGGQAAAPPLTDKKTDGAKGADLCPCYSTHYHGECECSCGCTCVIIGRILPLVMQEQAGGTAGTAAVDPYVKVDSDMVRRIRPVLNGYAQCRWPEKPAVADPPKPTPAAPVPAAPATPAPTPVG